MIYLIPPPLSASFLLLLELSNNHKYSLDLIPLVAISFTKKRRGFLVSSTLSLALGHANRIPRPIDLYIRCLTLLPHGIWMVPPMMIPRARARSWMVVSRIATIDRRRWIEVCDVCDVIQLILSIVTVK